MRQALRTYPAGDRTLSAGDIVVPVAMYARSMEQLRPKQGPALRSRERAQDMPEHCGSQSGC